MYKKLIIFVLLLISMASISAQNECTVSVKVVDQVSGKSMDKVNVSILGSDSTFIDSCTVVKILIPGNPEFIYYGQIKTSEPTILVKFNKKGYEQKILKVKLEKELDLGNVTLERSPIRLKETTVTASKIMMIMKGDTMVYNADAFQLAEGSMLDELITQLPGVKLENGRRITVNGNFVSNLLVNGKDFFKGDPNVALKNLPAYMVNKVKSYQKTPDNAYLTRKDQTKARSDDPWVIDVVLKRQYSQGWIANAEAGYGTDQRWLGRLFGLRFTDHSRLAVYASGNNLNNTGSPSADSGNWSEQTSSTGLITQKQGGINFNVDGKKTNARFSTALTATRTSTDLQSYTSSTSFLPTGNILLTSRNASRDKATSANWTSEFILPHPNLFLSFNTILRYNHATAGNDLTQSTWYDRQTDENLTYTLGNLLKNERTNWNATGILSLDFQPFKNGNTFHVLADGSYFTEQAKAASHYDLYPRSTATRDLRNRYDDTPSRQYSYDFLLDYELINASHKNITNILSVDYEYRQSFKSGSRTLYRLERLGGQWERLSTETLGLLPSSKDSLTLATDWTNTFHTTEHSRRHKGELRWYYSYNNIKTTISIPVLTGTDKIDDFRNYTPREHSRHIFTIQPQLNFSYKNVRLLAKTEREYPSQLLLLDVRDDSDPLAVYLGNPALEPSDYYSASVYYSGAKTELQRNYTLSLNYNIIQNAIGQARQYNSRTGVYTYTPRNINGNRLASASFNFSQAIDKKKRWQFTNDTKLSYNRSADFAQDIAVDPSEEKSIVNNFDWIQTLAVDFRQNGWQTGLKISADWGYATSSRISFQTINTVDLLYRFTLHAPLSFGIAADTDFSLFSRKGYNDASMNDNEWLWNASLSGSLNRRKTLFLKLSAHDILNQLSNIHRTINLQGRTEVWTNTLTRYLMLHLIYRFNKQPKQRNAIHR